MAIDAFLEAVTEHISRALAYVDTGVQLPSATREGFNPARALMRGGKRTRARLVRAGMLAAEPVPTASLQERAAMLAAGVELFQLAALIHDDVVDHSPTRRGVPAYHVALEETHARRSWRGDSADFGRSAAVVLGDALLGSAVSLAAQAAADAPAVMTRFARMITSVGWGQYLDLRSEVQPLRAAETAQREAMEVISLKTVGYSAVDPLLMGALLGGAGTEMTDVLESFARPFGVAFQLQDDALGVFGDPAETGKPAGGDLAEGKHTVLLALTRERATSAQMRAIDALAGSKPTTAQVERARRVITECGAQRAHEALIARYEAAARSVLTAIPEPARGTLASFLDGLSGRSR
ncbi:polyprenyl synthetase family protein [Neoactinobaculum massilliense]|uniref:polyprenyl synthetase family protein n=1 Tax=Neoactinobaculum massilliense TaxID=2364794 RepID=UPI000F52CC64|nr:polyprenyl synthetase family protein [Neoactinobaculum massilliense]